MSRIPAPAFLRLIAAALAAAALCPAPACAQTVQSITPSTPDLGTVVSGASGNTVFRVSSSSGAITRVSGTGVRLTAGNSRSLVTIACNTTACRNSALNVRVGSIGSPSGRAAALTNFTVTAGTAVFSVAPTGTNPVSFRIQGIPQGSTATFWVGADFPIQGDTSTAATGNASSGFYVYVAVAPTVPTTGSTAGLAVAKVFRPINIAQATGLSFGKVVRPSSGSGTVSINAASGVRSVTGTGTVGLSSPAPTRASYTVSGEGGQAFSLSVPTSFTMTGPGTQLTVSLVPTASGAQTLSSALGSAGTFGFGVGGSFPITSSTVSGAYQGSYSITVQYN
jgi:hypothetical protein